jgi:putative membrane protein
MMRTPPIEGRRPEQKPSNLRTLVEALWPPLPVWRRLDLITVAVTGYAVLTTWVVLTQDIHLPQWGGGSAILNALILGVLLGFRNNQSYDRWWEGRKLWGQLVNDSRNLCLKAAALPDLTADTRRRVGVLVSGFAVALKRRLRDEAVLSQIPGFEGDPATPAHVPGYVAGTLYKLVQGERAAGRRTELDVILLDPHLKALMDVCGACERIKTSPIPLSYRSLLRHGLLLYLLSTPWLIADQLGWATVPVITLMTYFLLGIELTAEEIEEPFGRDGEDLALGRYCDTIRVSAQQALGSAVPEDVSFV